MMTIINTDINVTIHGLCYARWRNPTLGTRTKRFEANRSLCKTVLFFFFYTSKLVTSATHFLRFILLYFALFPLSFLALHRVEDRSNERCTASQSRVCSVASVSALRRFTVPDGQIRSVVCNREMQIVSD